MGMKKWYNINPILQTKANYNIIIGQPYIGKTVSIIKHILNRFINYNVFDFVNYYVNDITGSYKYIEQLIQDELKTYYTFNSILRVDGIHYNYKTYETPKPFIYVSKLNDMNTWKRDYEKKPVNVIFDDVVFNNVNNADKILSFLSYVHVNSETKIWIIGNTWGNPKEFLRQFLIKDFPNKAGLYTYDISEDVRISVEVIK